MLRKDRFHFFASLGKDDPPLKKNTLFFFLFLNFGQERSRHLKFDPIASLIMKYKKEKLKFSQNCFNITKTKKITNQTLQNNT